MNKPPVFEDHIAPLEAVIAAARAAGASSADAMIADDSSLSVGIRIGKMEKCEQSGSKALGLRVFVGRQSATISTNDLQSVNARDLAERAVTMAKAAPADEFSGLADADQLATEEVQIDSVDPDFALDAAELQRWCEEAEGAALAMEGITNSEGAEAGAGAYRSTLMTSNGFAGSRASTSYSFSASVLASSADGRMVTDYDYSSAIYRGDLRAPEAVGRRAAERALAMRGADAVETMKDVSVIFDRRISSSMLGHLLSAINGSAVALGRSYLAGKLGEKIFSDAITILDEPHLPRGLRSRPFDAEGLPTRPAAIVEKGVLKSYILNLHSARQLKLAPTGHGARGVGSQPGASASNLALLPGALSPEELRRDIKRGIYVTEFIGYGPNIITGDYSRGIAGFLIENGELTRPITEVTIASTMPHIFREMVAASDLVREFGIDSPTIRVDGMTLAGR